MERVLEKYRYQYVKQVLSNFFFFFLFFFSISKNFAKYHLHAKFRISLTIQTEIADGGIICACPHPDIPMCKKPSLFRVNSYQMTFSSFHTCSDAEAAVVQCTTQAPSTLPRSPISNRMTQDPDHLLQCCQVTICDCAHFLVCKRESGSCGRLTEILSFCG